jgi:pyridoxal phosphate enzyme (YggS family)
VNDRAAEIAGNVAAVRERIEGAARRAGRDPGEVTLVAVTKAVPAHDVAAAVAAGVCDIGENRAQELVAKAAALGVLAGGGPAHVDAGPGGAGAVRWHFVGRLQSNKVRAVAAIAARIHSVDRPSLVGPLTRHARAVPLLVQVDLAGEPQKGGCEPAEVGGLVERLVAAGCRVDGLMTVPPLGDDPRPWFDALAVLAGGLGLPQLSMGMSDDFEVAVERGATIVRVGRALFGPRAETPGMQG